MRFKRFFRRRWVIGAVAALLGAAATLVAINLAPEPRELKEPLPHHLAASDQQFRLSMGALFGSNFIPGNRIESLVNGDRIFPAMLQAIGAARNTITFETYIYWAGDIANRFADALAAKAREGVSVKVLLDWVGSIPMEEALVARMQAAGVEVVRFRPIHWYTLDRVNNRTHRKLLIVDGRIGFTGGVGIGDEWTGRRAQSQGMARQPLPAGRAGRGRTAGSLRRALDRGHRRVADGRPLLPGDRPCGRDRGPDRGQLDASAQRHASDADDGASPRPKPGSGSPRPISCPTRSRASNCWRRAGAASRSRSSCRARRPMRGW